MELQIINQNGVSHQTELSDSKFIESNTQSISLSEMRDRHIIPVFVKDNTPTISQAEFITTTQSIVEELSNAKTSNLVVRVSHPIKGRIYEARNKKASELLEHEKTLYYERMAFSFDIPSMGHTINGKKVTLSVVGVKAYNHDNLYGYGHGLQRFKVGIGQKVQVCTNMCLFTDGSSVDIKVRSLDELTNEITQLISNANIKGQISLLKQLGQYHLTQKQFATLLGKSRMYNHLPKDMKKEIPELLISDSQVSMVAKSYFNDKHFPKNADGGISLWNLYNLYTHAVKSSYIDSFVERNINAFTFIQGIRNALKVDNAYKWFLN